MLLEMTGYGHPTVGAGIDIFNGGFADLFTSMGYPTDIGGLVPKDFVDNLVNQEMNQHREYASSMTSGLGLTDYQIDALVSRAYNCGDGGAFKARGPESLTFVEAYKKYFTAADLTTTVNYDHKLFTQYMKYPNTSGGEYSRGLAKRRSAEWILFQTGVYAGNDNSLPTYK